MFPSVKNCNDFFKSRPPIITFLISLVIMMLATFSLALYVKYTERITNTDVKKNWASLATHLNNLDLCLNDTGEKSPQFVEETTFATLITVDFSKFENVTNVLAYYSLEGWRPYCPDDNKYDNPLFLTVNFMIPENLMVPVKICALIKGPKQYLPESYDHSCDLSESDDENTLVLYSQPKSCSNYTTKLQFDADYHFETYLSQSDKNIIYVHLMWCSIILLLFVLIILIYAMFHQSEYVYIKK